MEPQTIITFVLFSLEAYFHFVIGRGKPVVPTFTESLKIFGTVLLFSLASTSLTKRMATKN